MNPALRAARGATRFEFAVVAVVAAVLAAVLLHYVLRYRAEAELAAVRFQVASLRTALAGSVMKAHLTGDETAVRALVGSNPAALLERPLPGYRGEVDDMAKGEIPPGSWFYHRKQQSLVYLFSGNKTFSGVSYTSWSFRVESLCLPTNNAKPPGTPAKLSVALHQVDG